MVSAASQFDQKRDYVVVTGGGSRILEAANRTADDAGTKSIGLDITLPHKQRPNPYFTPDLSVQFQYSAIRKIHFLMRARAMVAFPSGFGTLNELFEALTLIQSGKIAPIPMLLLGREFWRNIINFEGMAKASVNSEQELDLVNYVKTAERPETPSAITTDGLICIDPTFHHDMSDLYRLPPNRIIIRI